MTVSNMETDEFPTPVPRHLPLARRFEAAMVLGLRKAALRGSHATARVHLLSWLRFSMPCVALAQQSAKQTKIGWLSPYSSRFNAQNRQAFRKSLEDLGHVEGRDIAIEFRYADGNFDRLLGLATELIEQKVDIIVTEATAAAVAARKATSAIPIVAISVTDPVGRGLVGASRDWRERDWPWLSVWVSTFSAKAWTSSRRWCRACRWLHCC